MVKKTIAKRYNRSFYVDMVIKPVKNDFGIDITFIKRLKAIAKRK